MRRWLGGALTALLAFTLLAVAGSELVVAQAETKRQVNYQGVSFSYDASLAMNVTAQMVVEPEEDVSTSLCGEGIYFPPFPDIIFKFEGYKPEGFGCPSIFIYDIHASRKTYDPRLGESDIRSHVDKLRPILSQKQDLRSLPGGYYQPLPSINAARVFISGQRFVNFRNGSGVRYLVHITHDVSPFAAGEIIYTYQGLSDDDRYYVAAIFPAWLAAHPPTPAPMTNKSVEDYNRHVSAEVDRAGNRAFVPNLDALDGMMQSLSTDGSVPGMPRTGHQAGDDWLRGATLLGFLSLVAVGALALQLTRRQERRS